MYRKITDPTQITDLTGFEKYLSKQGFEMFATNDYLNSYNSCGRLWSKGTFKINIHLIDTPCRVGIAYPFVTKDATYLPEESQYESRLKSLENRHRKYPMKTKSNGN